MSYVEIVPKPAYMNNTLISQDALKNIPRGYKTGKIVYSFGEKLKELSLLFPLDFFNFFAPRKQNVKLHAVHLRDGFLFRYTE